MNSNATKKQIEFPFQYNFCKDRPHVDSTLRNAEEINAPFLNDMMQPLYVKTYENKAIHDKAGNRYTITGGSFQKNGNELWSVKEQKFVKEDITEEMKEWISFDLHNGSIEGGLKFLSTSDDDQTSYYKLYYTHDDFIDIEYRYTLVTSRCRWIGDDLITVMIGADDTNYYITIYKNGDSLLSNRRIDWMTYYGVNNISSYAYVQYNGSLKNLPKIHIGQISGYLGISLTVCSGAVVEATDYNCFWTGFYVDGEWKIIGSGLDFKPTGSLEAVHGNDEVAFNTYSSTSTSTVTYFARYNSSGYYSIYNYSSSATRVQDLVATRLSFSNDYVTSHTIGTKVLSTGYTNTVCQESCTCCTTCSGNVCCMVCQCSYNSPRSTATYNVIQVKKNIRTFTLQLAGSSNFGYKTSYVYATIHNPNKRSEGTWVGEYYQIPTAGQGTTASNFGVSTISGQTQLTFQLSSPGQPSNSSNNSVSFSYVFYDEDPLPYVTYGNMTYYAYRQDSNYNWVQAYWSTINVSEYTKTNKTYSSSYTIPVTSFSGGNIYRAVPNIILDSGEMVTLLAINVSTQTKEGATSFWQSDQYKGTNFWAYATEISFPTSNTFYPSGRTTIVNLSTYPITRSGSAVIDQNFYSATYKFNNLSATNPASLANGVAEASGARFTEIEFNNTIFPFGRAVSTPRNGWRSLPGTTRKTNFNFYSYAVFNDATLGGNAEDLAIFTVGGTRTRLGISNFNLLYNITASGTGYLQGISYSPDEETMGTLLTPWQSIAEDAYVIVSGNICIYKDKANKWYKISIVEDEPELAAILEDRLIVINTTSYWNCYDYVTGERFHYATDFNQRVKYGSTYLNDFKGAIYQGSGNYKAYPYLRYTADGINTLYQTMPRWPVLSPIYPITARYRCYVGDEMLLNSNVPEDDKQYVDIYYSTQSSNNVVYRHSIHKTKVSDRFVINDDIVGLSYPGSTTTSPSLTPNIFTKYLNGAGNNDMVIEGYDSYILTYYDEQPYLVYSAATVTSNIYGSEDSFFVLQGQFYGVIGDKLYALSYNNGAIAGKDCIIDLGDLKFLGNNPMIAFWWDGAARVIKSFTGDANLDTIYSASKFTKFSGRHWYDTTTQSIYADTDKGLLVFGPRNTYCLTNFIDVTNIQFSNDGVTHITHEGKTDDLVYYKQDGYEVLPVKLETSFYGLGANEYTNIDRWDITLFDYNYESPTSYIKVGVRSLTDITVKSEDKTMTITPDMYDKWSHSVLIRYVPQLQKGQGIRLFLETPLTIQKIVPHMADLGTGTLTKKGL